MRNKLFMLLIALFAIIPATAQTYTYKPIEGFQKSTNSRLKTFLDSTKNLQERKVAVFDCDGTLFGQAPYYLADEALYEYAKKNYEGKTDSVSVAKMAIVDQLLHGDNVGVEYVKNRIKFLSGLTSDQIKQIGKDMYNEKYQGKMYPEMIDLIRNLENYGFEVWIVSASPELLYEGFCEEQLNLPNDRILGVRSRVTDGNLVTDELVFPVPQDEGKSDVVKTFIKAEPLFAGGNSRGDYELMQTSKGLKIMLNPDNKKKEKVTGGKTLLEFWEADPNCIVEWTVDQPKPGNTYVTEEWGVKNNVSNSKPYKPGE